MNKLFIAGVLAFVCAAGAQAAESGFYAGASVGQSTLQATAEDVGVAALDKRDTAYRIFGGYQFNQYVGAEAAYTNFGKVKLDTGTDQLSVKGQAASVAAVGALPLSKEFSLTGKAGLAYTQAEGAGTSEDHYGALLGVGAQYKLSREVSLRAEFERYLHYAGDDKPMDVVSVGAAYHF